MTASSARITNFDIPLLWSFFHFFHFSLLFFLAVLPGTVSGFFFSSFFVRKQRMRTTSDVYLFLFFLLPFSLTIFSYEAIVFGIFLPFFLSC